MEDNKISAAEAINRGRLMLGVSRFEAAQQCFAYALRQDAEAIGAYLGLGGAYLMQRNFKESKAAYEKALLLDAENGKALFALGNLCAAQGKAAQAAQYYNRARGVGFEHALLYSALFGIYRQSGQEADALFCINRAIALAPMTPTLYTSKLGYLIALGRLTEAEELLERMRLIFPHSPAVAEMEVQFLLTGGKMEEALQRAEEYARAQPDSLRLSVLRLTALMRAGNGERYLDEIRAEIARARQHPQAATAARTLHLYEGALAIREGRLSEGEALLAQALEDQPGEVEEGEILYMLALVYVRSQRYAELLACAERMQASEDKSARAAAGGYLRALALERLGRLEEAGQAYREMARAYRRMSIHSPKTFEYYIYRGLCHLGAEQYAEALDLADFMVSVYPQNPDCRLIRYRALQGLGREAEAAQEAETIRDISPLLDACIKDGGK